MTVRNPQSLADLEYQTHVVSVKEGEAFQSVANRFFHELFHPTDIVFVRILFQEDGREVYQCYQDSGSDDYLYLVVSI